MNDLLEKLEAAIAETERIATRAAQARKGASTWTFVRGNEDVEPAVFIGERSLYSEWHGVDYLVPSEVEHIALNDPERVLRRVARDRKLLALHVIYDKIAPDDFWKTGAHLCEVCSRTLDGELIHDDGPACATVLLLAEDYEIEVES